MVVMLWIVVFVVKGTFHTIPTVDSYGAGVFCSRLVATLESTIGSIVPYQPYPLLLPHSIAQAKANDKLKSWEASIFSIKYYHTHIHLFF
jgi:hypothetical protein